MRAEFAENRLDRLLPLHASVLVPLLGGGRRAFDLADTLGVTRQAIAQVTSTLERNGYVERIPDRGDARAKLICLTARGRAALRVMRASALAAEDQWRDVLGAEQLIALREMLTTLLDATNQAAAAAR